MNEVFMEYDDNAISNQYEKMARAYFGQLKDKGFVFMRLDNNQGEVKKLAEKTVACMLEMLSGYTKIEPYLKKNEKDFLNRLYFLTTNQISVLQRIFDLNKRAEQVTRQSIRKIVSKEAMLLEHLFNLLLLVEDDNFVIIKNIIFERLKLLQEE